MGVLPHQSEGNMKTEFRFCEVRREGRVLAGKAITYGDVASVGSGRERFVPGAFGSLADADVLLNVQHDRARPLARTGGGGLTLTDSAAALEVRAELPASASADETLALVAAGVLRGFSIEFVAQRERMESGVRVLLAARLVNIGVVDRPAYSQSTVAARAEDEAAREWERWRREVET